MSRRVIELEGYSPEEILAMEPSQLAEFVFTKEPIVFQIGSAEVLGEFRLREDRLVIELAQIEGGGEGVLPALAALARAYARARGLSQVEWIVHAVTCANPNLKLRRVLQRRGFVVREIPGVGEAYHLVEAVAA